MKTKNIILIVATVGAMGLRPAAEVGAQQTDAITREFTVFNGPLSPPVIFTDAVSREFSVYNGLIAPPLVLSDAVSRELSIKNIFLCKGNMTNDGLVTLADIPTFVSVLIGQTNDLYLTQAADVNCDGTANGLDIQPFVNCMVVGTCP